MCRALLIPWHSAASHWSGRRNPRRYLSRQASPLHRLSLKTYRQHPPRHRQPALSSQHHKSANMKPVVGVMQAWSCVVISCFAIVILSVIGTLFQKNHHSMMGSTDDPPNGAAVAATVFSAVAVYGLFLIGCGFQAYLHFRENRKGAVRL